MADGAVNFTGDKELMLFSVAGKTMLGYFWKESAISQNQEINSGAHAACGTPSSFYVVENPAVVEYTLSVSGDKPTTADLKWNIIPLFYSVNSTNTAKTPTFTFSKEQVALSNIGGTILDSKIVNAYKELTGAN